MTTSKESEISKVSNKIIESNNDSEFLKTTRMEKHFDLAYPNAISLNMKYYDKETFNYIRRCKLILFSHCLGDNKTFDKLNIIIENTIQLTKEHIVKYLERGCLNRAIKKAKTYNIRCVWANEKFIDVYHSICYKVACNIDPTSSVESDYIFKKIINNEVNLNDVANMTSKELCPKKYEVFNKKINKRVNIERKIKYSELYRCSKCKRNQTTTERRYARSLDEGVDLTINCVFCGHSWNA
jgi:DNA-directed RNA polymerase subunit M/transcription elongation factor TFIIS